MSFKTYGLWRAAAAALALLFAGCTGAPTVAEIQEDVPDWTASMLRAANQSAKTASAGETATTLNDVSGAEVGLNERFAEDAKVDAELERLRAYLRDRVFTEAHYEETKGGMAIFRLTDKVCTDGRPLSLPMPSCLLFFKEVDLRLGVERGAKNGLDVTVMLGKDRAAPLTYEVSEQRLALRVALGELHASVRALGPGGNVLATTLPEVLSGRVRTSLEKLNKDGKEFEFAFSVLDDVRVETNADSVHNILFTTVASDPLLSLRVNAATNAIKLGFDLGETRVELPYRNVVPDGIAGTRFSVNLQGASAILEGADGQAIKLSNLSLGDGEASVKLDAFTLFSARLNEGLGDKASITAERRADGITDLTVSPGVDLAMNFALAAIADDAVVPDALLDAAFRFAFTADSGLPLLRAFGPNWGTGASGYAEIINGTMRFEHVGNGSVVATAGQCVTAATPAEGEDPILASFEVTACR